MNIFTALLDRLNPRRPIERRFQSLKSRLELNPTDRTAAQELDSTLLDAYFSGYHTLARNIAVESDRHKPASELTTPSHHTER